MAMSSLVRDAPRLVALPRNAIEALRGAGVEVDELARRLGAASATARMPAGTSHRLLAEALGAIRDPAFALRTGGLVRPELFGVVGLAAMTARTFGAALARLARYTRVLGGGAYELLAVPGGTLVRRHPVAVAIPSVVRAHVDYELASMVAIGRRLTERPLAPRGVRLRGAPPPHADAYPEILGVAPQFGAPFDEIVFEEEDLERVLISRSRVRDAYFVQLADELVEECEGPSVDAVRTAIRRLLVHGPPELASVARSVGTSARSLQRLLEANDETFTKVVDDVRRAEVCHLLVSTDHRLAEIAARVGFASPGVLHRAFQRWEGTTPLAYRAHGRD